VNKKDRELLNYLGLKQDIDILKNRLKLEENNRRDNFIALFIVLVIFLVLILFSTFSKLDYKLECKEYQVEEVAEKQRDCMCTYFNGDIPHAIEDKYKYFCDEDELVYMSCEWSEWKAVLVNKTTDKCLEYKVVPR
jgi:hypothetical protein